MPELGLSKLLSPLRGRGPMSEVKQPPGARRSVCLQESDSAHWPVPPPYPSPVFLQPPSLSPFYPLVFGVVLLQDSFSRGSQRSVRMSQSQISAVIAAVHKSLKVDEIRASLVAQLVKNPPAMQETQV